MRRSFFPNGGRKSTETSVTAFCYKSINLSLEKLKNNKIILFPIREVFRCSQIPRNKSLFNQLGRHVNAASRKILKIQVWSITKLRTHSEQKLSWILVFSCSYTSLRAKKLYCKSVAKEISKTPFLAPEVQWTSKFTVFVRFTFPLNVSNHAHIW